MITTSKKTLLLSPRYSEDSIALWRAARQEGHPTQRLQGWRLQGTPPQGELILYGEPLFIAGLAEQLSLNLLEPPLDWLTQLPQRYLKREIRFGQLGGLSEITLPAFLKPADDKSFPARVYQAPEELSDLVQLPKSLPILCSEPVHWESEFRAFFRERRCLSWSIYARHGALAQAEDGGWPCSPEERKQAEAFIACLEADPLLPLCPSWVIDFGHIRGRGWAAVEANPAWSSGLYGCDPRAVLRVIARGCLSDTALKPGDRAWRLERVELS